MIEEMEALTFSRILSALITQLWMQRSVKEMFGK